MKLWSIVICLCLSFAVAGQATTQSDTQSSVRFVALDVYVDSGNQPLAAYQFELSDPTGAFIIVGIEGGEHNAFNQPPYYDPKALSNDRIIVAAFNTADDLPTGKTRIARIHGRITGDKDPDYSINLTVSVTTDGTDVPATISIAQGE